MILLSVVKCEAYRHTAERPMAPSVACRGFYASACILDGGQELPLGWELLALWL